MNTQVILKELNRNKKSFNVYERRPGKYQLTVPILHEDGDMIDIYLQDSPQGTGYVRINDFGLTLQRLSYSYDLNTPSKRKIFNSILINNDVQNDNGALYLDVPIKKVYESVFQFAGCVQKVCNMEYWSREIIKSAFYNDLNNFVTAELKEFSPEPDVTPLRGYEVVKVDWSLKWKARQFYLFGVLGNNKAKDSAIALLEFKKANLPFISLVVHEDIESLGNKEVKYLTKNADKQYPVLEDLKETGPADIKRMAS